MRKASRTPDGCYSAGYVIGEIETSLRMAHFAASEGAVGVAREILKGTRNVALFLETVGSRKEVKALRSKFEDAMAQKTPSMVERKTKYLLQDVEKFTVKARQTCLGHKPRSR
jgi:hypothetical protein